MVTTVQVVALNGENFARISAKKKVQPLSQKNKVGCFDLNLQFIAKNCWRIPMKYVPFRAKVK